MLKTLKFGNVVLCEHAVLGMNNKHTLVNVFCGDIIVQKFPARLTFGLFAEVAQTPDISEAILEFKLDKTTYFKAQMILSEPNENRIGIILIPLIQLQIEKEATFNVVARASGYRSKTFLKKRIFLGNIPGG